MLVLEENSQTGSFGASAQSARDAPGHPEGPVSAQGWPDLGTIRH